MPLMSSECQYHKNALAHRHYSAFSESRRLQPPCVRKICAAHTKLMNLPQQILEDVKISFIRPESLHRMPEACNPWTSWFVACDVSQIQHGHDVMCTRPITNTIQGRSCCFSVMGSAMGRTIDQSFKPVPVFCRQYWCIAAGFGDTAILWVVDQVC